MLTVKRIAMMFSLNALCLNTAAWAITGNVLYLITVVLFSIIFVLQSTLEPPHVDS